MKLHRVLFTRVVVLLTLSIVFCAAAQADDDCLKNCQTDDFNCMANLQKIPGGSPQGCIALFTACKNRCPPPPPPPKVTHIGDWCTAAVCSAPHLACYDGHCACQPGFVACGTECVDVVNDEHTCGACGISCAKGEKCVSGECLAANQQPSQPKESKAGSRFDVTPGQCSEYESHPVLSANDGIMFQASGNADIGQVVSWAKVSSPTNWKISNTVEAAKTTTEAKGQDFQPPACGPKGKASQTDCPLTPGGDVWATTSGFSGLEYVAARVSWNFFSPPFNNPSVTTHTSSPGLLAVQASDLQAGNLPKAQWALPISEADDGLTAAYDAGGTSLWIAATCGQPAGASSGHPCAVLFPHCKGTVDSQTCSRAKIGAGDAEVADPMLDAPDNGRSNHGHTTVIVNPCTHHALVSFLEEDSNDAGFVTVSAVDRQGKMVAKWRHHQDFVGNDTKCPDASPQHIANCTVRPLCPDPAATNTNCCDSGDSCNPGATSSIVSRVVGRVQMDVKVWGSGADAKCTLYVGWDSAQGEPGPVRRAATLASLDVTGDAIGNESANTQFKVLTQVKHEGESMNATPVASRFSDALALIYVQRSADGTTETLRARVSRDREFDDFTDLAVSNKNPNSWFGDSLSELLGGLPGGAILATWPELTNSSCETIDGALVTVGLEKGKNDQPPSPQAPEVPRADPALWRSIPADGRR